MERFFTGPYATVLVLLALAAFAWMYSDLLRTIREDNRPGRRRYRQTQSWGPGPAGRLEDIWRAPAPPNGPRILVQTSTVLDTWIERDTGEPRGVVKEGPYRGRELPTLTRADCLRLYEFCLHSDAEAARMLSDYLNRRFAGGQQAKPPKPEPRPTGPRMPRNLDRPLTREDASAILGVAEDASRAEIALAHRALIKKYHPDHGGTNTEAAVVNEAKDILLGRKGRPPRED